MKHLKIILLTVIGIFGLLTACNQDDKEENTNPSYAVTKIEEIDPYVQNMIDSFGIIGLQAAIVKDGELLWSNGYGFANKEAKYLETAQTIHMIASVTKTVTAVAALQLVEAGKITLDGNINDYLPFKVENPNFPNERITPRQLMTHQSSITDAYFEEVLEPNLATIYGIETDAALSLKDFCAAFLLKNGTFYNSKTYNKKKPGAEEIYSNIGVALLGLMVEHVSGKPFYQYAKERIFQPLGMNNTSFRLADFQTNKLSQMYQVNGTPWGNYTMSLYPAGGLRSNVQDMSKFLRAIMNNGSLNGTQILSAATVKEMLREQIGGTKRGLIWDVDAPLIDISVSGHGGEAAGMYTNMYFNKTTNVGALVFSNTDFKNEQDLASIYIILANLIHVGEQQ